jgi:hypothetical protein
MLCVLHIDFSLSSEIFCCLAKEIVTRRIAKQMCSALLLFLIALTYSDMHTKVTLNNSNKAEHICLVTVVQCYFSVHVTVS